MTDTWNNRDLPVLRAIVAHYDENGLSPSSSEVAHLVDMQVEDVRRAMRALSLESFFTDAYQTLDGDISVEAPTGHALRVAGQWPTPEAQLDRLIAAFEAVAADDHQPEAERSRAKQLGLWLSGAAAQVAIGALGGAGGNIMSG